MNLLSHQRMPQRFIGNKMRDVAVLRSSVMSTEVETALTILPTPGRPYPSSAGSGD
jgi:hypothetical protein